MSYQHVFRVEYEVRGFDCGYGGPFTPLALANYFQEAAGLHAAALGIGMGDLAAQGRTWMLSRIQLRVEALPREGERVAVKTWPSGCDRLFALRDLALEREDGTPLVQAVYAYLVVDAVARKPLRPERALGAVPLGAPEHALAELRLGAATAARPEAIYRLTARRRHIDENGHVNNAHYVNWLVDAAAGLVEGPLRELRVDFVREVLEGELLDALAARADGRKVLTELRRAGEPVARAELDFGD